MSEGKCNGCGTPCRRLVPNRKGFVLCGQCAEIANVLRLKTRVMDGLDEAEAAYIRAKAEIEKSKQRTRVAALATFISVLCLFIILKFPQIKKEALFIQLSSSLAQMIFFFVDWRQSKHEREQRDKAN